MRKNCKYYSYMLFIIIAIFAPLNSMEPLPTQPSRLERLIQEKPWVKTIAHLLLGIGNIDMLWKESVTFPFSDLPTDMQHVIIEFVASGVTSKTLEGATQAINNLTLINKSLNELINNKTFFIQLTRSLAERFHSSEEEICVMLHTKTAKAYCAANRHIKTILNQHISPEEMIQRLKTTPNLDLNFRFNSLGIQFYNAIIIPTIVGGGNILMEAYHFNNKELQDFLKTQPININLVNKYGRTALMVAVNGLSDQQNHPAITFLQNYPTVDIDKQDRDGNTALLLALATSQKIKGQEPIRYGITTVFKDRIVTLPRTPNYQVIKTLIDAGADPEISNYSGLTPLQAAIDTKDDAIIQLIINALENNNYK